MRVWQGWLLGLLGLLLFPLAASAQGDGTAQLRVVHGLSTVPAVDVYLDGQRIIAALPYGEATAYGVAEGGAHEIAIRPATAAGTAAPLLQKRLELANGGSYTLALAGTTGEVDGFLYTDDRADSEGKALFRLVNLAPAQGQVAAALDEAALTGLVPYGGTSGRVGVAAQAQPPTVRVIAPSGKAVAASPPIPFQPDQYYTLFLVGNGSAPEPLVVSYPLATASTPAATLWLPLSVNNSGAGQSPATTLPQAGAERSASAIPFWLMLDGFLFLLLLLVARWGWESLRVGR